MHILYFYDYTHTTTMYTSCRTLSPHRSRPICAFADGSSAGTGRRLQRRVPGPLLLGPLPLTWALGVVGPVAGPLLLAAEQWALGAAVLLVGAVPARLAVRALHGLARRWVVFVPAGMVLADPARSAERRVGKGCGSTCRFRWSPVH